MAMFDDPKKELQRLEEQLRAEEEFDDELAGIEDLLQDYEEEDFSGCFREPEEDDVAYRRPDAYTRNMSDMLLEEEAPEAPKQQKPRRKRALWAWLLSASWKPRPLWACWLGGTCVCAEAGGAVCPHAFGPDAPGQCVCGPDRLAVCPQPGR